MIGQIVRGSKLGEHIFELIIDGGEFSGYIEFMKLWKKCKFIVLDDINSFKHKNSRKFILDHPEEKNNLEFIFENRLSFEDYCIHMSHHKYVICPPGNGIDTHRLWEALYMKCIPIVLKHRIYENYDLPIIQVNKWEDINKEILNKELTQNEEQLYIDYWNNKIIKEFNNL